MSIPSIPIEGIRSNRSDIRVIGLIGGMSWVSSTVYYQRINQTVQDRLGSSHSARLLLWSDDYERVEKAQLSGDWVEAGKLLALAARRLESGGAEILAVACNTMHRVASAVRETSDLPFVDLVDSTSRAAHAHGVRRAVVLGTRFTLEMPRYHESLLAHGVEPVIPECADRELLDRVIYDELCIGVISDSARHILQQVVGRAIASGADGVILACTELGLVVDDDVAQGASIVDSTEAHVAALVEASLRPRLGREAAQ